LADLPKLWLDDGLPKSSIIILVISCTTSCRIGVVAALSKYIFFIETKISNVWIFK
jgi:hypothetical protein